MKRVASPGSMHDTGCLGLVHWDDPEGWCGEEGGGFRMGSTCMPEADSFWCLAKLIQCFRFKNKIKLKKKEIEVNENPKKTGGERLEPEGRHYSGKDLLWMEYREVVRTDNEWTSAFHCFALI